ncbi:hypothetical protein RRG08_029161 [Elysia crispata]|uniref:Uncharacterized protein n=1 Tax=Elysia crispata TaxID=231223 RepID=A0AAE1AJ96_9GAST|nr:hypothetical protein RRG08_029161 [Elysia crispata]
MRTSLSSTKQAEVFGYGKDMTEENNVTIMCYRIIHCHMLHRCIIHVIPVTSPSGHAFANPVQQWVLKLVGVTINIQSSRKAQKIDPASRLLNEPSKIKMKFPKYVSGRHFLSVLWSCVTKLLLQEFSRLRWGHGGSSSELASTLVRVNDTPADCFIKFGLGRDLEVLILKLAACKWAILLMSFHATQALES